MSTLKSISTYIDYTNLRPDTSYSVIEKLCNEAITHRFAAVCIHPCWINKAASICQDSGVNVCTVIGFPHGANIPEVKAYEAAKAVEAGAQELDMVINIGFMKSGMYSQVQYEIADVVKAAQGRLVKVIIETCYLSEDEKRMACLLAQQAGAGYVKTSTGFGSSGATVEDISLMRSVVGDSMGVKASGGIRDLATALRMIEAGASRIGTSTIYPI